MANIDMPGKAIRLQVKSITNISGKNWRQPGKKTSVITDQCLCFRNYLK